MTCTHVVINKLQKSAPVCPVAIFTDKLLQFLDGILIRNMPLNKFLSFVKIYIVLSGTNKTIIGIAHFAGPVHHAPHDTNLEVIQMAEMLLDLSGGFMQVE